MNDDRNRSSFALQPIKLIHARQVVFGIGAAEQCAQDLVSRGVRRVFVVTSSPVASLAEPISRRLRQSGADVEIYPGIDSEPDVSMFNESLESARRFGPDAVVGLGGGSAMDVSKLIAALLHSPQTVREVFGIDLLEGRETYLVCLPTTSGTGSEVSPNSIMLDEHERLKKGVVSPHLVPDGAYVDPGLTVSMPDAVTASTGMDALTHCIEAYANLHAHPIIDIYALEGIRLISENLASVMANGRDLEARAAMSLGSLYGGVCLGPVNTAAVHALAYPLGSEFHIAHGVSNAVLLPHVLEFNLSAGIERYAQIARAMGLKADLDEQLAQMALQRIRELSSQCGITQSLADFGVPRDALSRMAKAAMTVTRLLKNNLRPLTELDAEAIYRAAF